LIDAHNHAGHNLVRTLAMHAGQAWNDVLEEIYARGSTVGFWQADARLSLLERLKAGVTTAVSLLGGATDVMRTDEAAYGDAHLDAVEESGLRTIVAVGPGRAPFPKAFRRLATGNGGTVDHDLVVSFAGQMAVAEDLMRRRHDPLGRGTGIALFLPVYRAADLADASGAAEIKAMVARAAAVRAEHQVMFVQDGHKTGDPERMRDYGLLGPHALLSHAIDLSEADITAVRDSGSAIVHNPNAIAAIHGRCPVPELLAMGVRVAIGSDAAAPDRGVDMFRHMTQCLHYHRRHFRDPDILSAGQALAMTTIGAAAALGLDQHIGSIETGKVADIILLDVARPHLTPFVMPVAQTVHFANAADVDTVIAGGRLLMHGRQPLAVVESAILAAAETEAAAAVGRAGAGRWLEETPAVWGG
ncbi:MAG: amidohydrolase family protein, partial [Alphaproteobacteria bacterium]